jgi:hypothetical protein
MKIYTTLKGKREAEETDFKEWYELIESGWIFIGLNKSKHALMTRNGYINEFWDDQEVQE